MLFYRDNPRGYFTWQIPYAMQLRLPIRRFFQGTEKIEPAANRLGVAQWVLARPLCRYRKFDISQVPKKNRFQALQLELGQWTPFAESSYYIGWRGDQALVWCWDRSKTEQAIRSQRLNPKRIQVLPETLLRSPTQDGVRLMHCFEGFEGQVWQQGALAHSRWWPLMPSAEDWLMFQRDASIVPEAQQHQPPAAQLSQFNARPWLTTAGDHADINQNESRVIAFGILLLMLPTLWYGTNLYKIHQAKVHYENTLAQLKPQADPIMLARNQALDYLVRIRSLQAFAQYPEQLVLMSNVAEVLRNDELHLKDWNFQSGKLKITLASSNEIASTALIGRLQLTGYFRDVKALTSQNSKMLILQMDVLEN